MTQQKILGYLLLILFTSTAFAQFNLALPGENKSGRGSRALFETPIAQDTKICASTLSEINSKNSLRQALGKFLFKDGKALQSGDVLNFGAKNSDDMVISLDSCCSNKEHVNADSVFKLSVNRSGELQAELGGNVGAAKIRKICSDSRGISMEFSYPRRVFVTSELKHFDAEPLDFKLRLEKSEEGQLQMNSSFVVDNKSYKYSDRGLKLVTQDEIDSQKVSLTPAKSGVQ